MRDTSAAAIASALAAEIYGLKILKADVEDEHHNMTRFLIMSREPDDAPNSGKVVTSFVFRVKNVPAALYKAMGGFATNGVNMTKLESYQLGGSFNATQFYADIQGHPEDPPVMRALEELAFSPPASPSWGSIRPTLSAKICPSAALLHVGGVARRSRSPNCPHRSSLLASAQNCSR